MEVNGHREEFWPPLVLHDQTPTRVTLKGLLKSGTNELKLTFEIAPGSAPLRIVLDPLDFPHLVLIAVALAAFGAFLAGIHFYSKRALPASLAAILLLGISIRVLYNSGTAYSARSYDTPGHVEYIKYVASEGKLPPALMGWETHQPPLYYLTCAAVMRGLGMESNSVLYSAWQLLSLLLSIGAFLLCYPIGVRLLGPPIANPLPHAIFLTVLAVYPGFVFTASRINNDSLFNFLAFLWFWLALRAWEVPRLGSWVPVAVCLGLGVLTKNTTLPLIAVTACLIALNKRAGWRAKLIHTGTVATIIVLMAGWYQLPRAFSSNTPVSFIAANHDMGPGLSIPRLPARMATFNPIEVFNIPFNNTWKDESRRMYLAEAFFKSSLFGEWTWGAHLLLPARALVVCTMALVLVSLVGFFGAVRSSEPMLIPTFLTAGAVVGSVLLYFWNLPYACNQDFRFAILFLAPFAYWISHASKRWPIPAAVVVIAFAANALTFLAILVYV